MMSPFLMLKFEKNNNGTILGIPKSPKIQGIPKKSWKFWIFFGIFWIWIFWEGVPNLKQKFFFGSFWDFFWS